VPRKSPYTIRLTSAERSRLLEIVSNYTLPYMDVIHAKIILFAAEGMTNDQIGKKLGTSRQSVSKWRKRFFEQGFEGLDGSSRCGRPPRLSQERKRNSD
jgi:CRP-like cAMP-binding protein